MRLGISSCLLGNSVRYDGGHKCDIFVTQTLARYFDLTPVCPEVAIGLGIPRPPIRLIGESARPRAVAVRDPAVDVTEALTAYGATQARSMSDICGYIFKSRSPSCGLTRVPVRDPAGRRTGAGAGIYAKAFCAARALLPVADEDRLAEPVWRDNFIERVFAYRRGQELMAGEVTVARLQEFHEAHMLTLLAHGPRCYAELQSLLVHMTAADVATRAPAYIERFLGMLKRRATPSTHAHALLHALGSLKNHLRANDATLMLDAIDRYRAGGLPLTAPITLLRNHFDRYPDAPMRRQVYLYPDAREFALRYPT